MNDALGGSPLNGRYWMWGGLLLGWAREGGLLQHDLLDADFCYAEEDGEYAKGLWVLERAGFRRGVCFQNNRGEITEQTFLRHGAKFEFFRMKQTADEWKYHLYGWRDGGGPVQLNGSLPKQELTPFEFLDRTWLKAADHELELTLLYGDWRTPNLAWNYLDQGGIDDEEPWVGRPDLALRAIRHLETDTA